MSSDISQDTAGSACAGCATRTNSIAMRCSIRWPRSPIGLRNAELRPVNAPFCPARPGAIRNSVQLPARTVKLHADGVNHRRTNMSPKKTVDLADDESASKPMQDWGLFSYMLAGQERWGVRLRVNGRLWQRQGYKSKNEAKAFRDKVRGERHETIFFPEKYQRRKTNGTTIADLLQLVVDDFRRNNRKHMEDALEFQRFWTAFRGKAKASEITGTMLIQWADRWILAGTSPARINRRMSKLLRGYRLGLAQDPPMISRMPKWTKLQESDTRSGFMEWQDFDLIRRELPDYARIPATIAFWTGMRYGEIVSLLWSQITFDPYRKTVRIQLTGKTKNGRPRQVIMPGDLYET